MPAPALDGGLRYGRTGTSICVHCCGSLYLRPVPGPEWRGFLQAAQGFAQLVRSFNPFCVYGLFDADCMVFHAFGRRFYAALQKWELS